MMGIFEDFEKAKPELEKKVEEIEKAVVPSEEITKEEPLAEVQPIEIKKIEESVKEFKAVDLAELHKERGLKILIYGLPGTGKTHFCLTAPDPIVFIDTEFSVDQFYPLVKNKKVYCYQIFEYDKNTFEMDSITMLKKVEKSIYEITNIIKPKTIVIDSGTSIWQYLQDWLRYEIVKIGDKLNKKGVPADRRDWWRANSKYYGILMSLLASPANLIITAQSKPDYDQLGNPIGATPSMQKYTPYWVGVILETESEILPTGEVKFYATIRKCRTPTTEPLVGVKIENPSFEKLVNLIKSKEVK
jgi:hypothetical protein